MVTKFKNHLAKTNLAKNTVTSYVWTVQYFLSHYGEVNKKNLLAYKGYLVENFKPQTVNLRLQGINKYLEFTKQEKLKVKFVKVQQKNFLENVISDADYKFLKAQLKADGYDEWYFIVWFMAATGARVSELLHIKAEHIQIGHLDLYSKGGKIRRLYIPKNLSTEVTKFKNHLAKTNLAKNTVTSYVWTVQYFLNHYGEVNKKNLLAYKGYLVENFKPQTVNLRLQGINKYLEFTKQEKLKVKFVKVQQKNFLENVISDADYKFLKAQLKADGYDEWYFIVWFMAATGARVSELLHIKAEHIQIGHLDLYSKGGKIRRLYIPKNLRTEAAKWLKEIGLTSGYIFLNRFGQRITTRGIASQLKHFAEKYGMNKEVVYPHSFRHRFAKNFLDRFNDLALLADLMGHESIETTRIYLRRTASEQQKIVDKVVNW